LKVGAVTQWIAADVSRGGQDVIHTLEFRRRLCELTLASPPNVHKMPPRFTLTLNASAALRVGRLAARRAWYSTEANARPLVRVTDLPAPNSGHIRILALNRPAARNALSRALLSSLREEIDAIHA